MSNVTASAQNTRQYDASQYLTPVALCSALQLTNDELVRGCQVFRLPASVNGLDKEVFAVCEPVSVWQWLAKDALVLFAGYSEWEDDMAPEGEQHFSELATCVGRVAQLDKRAKTLTFAIDQGEVQYEERDVRELWLIGRAIVAQEARMAA